MTRRSQIRAAEMDVIDSADAMVAAKRGGESMAAFHADLATKVDKLKELGLITPDDAPTGEKAPLTSEQAGRFMEGKRAQYAINKIVNYLSDITRNGDEGTTAEEAMYDLNLHHQTTYARFSTLRKYGWTVEDGERDTRSGHSAKVVKFSRRARQLLGLPMGTL